MNAIVSTIVRRRTIDVHPCAMGISIESLPFREPFSNPKKGTPHAVEFLRERLNFKTAALNLDDKHVFTHTRNLAYLPSLAYSAYSLECESASSSIFSR